MKGSIRQRNPGSWELQVFLGRDSNGKRLRKTETVHGKKSEAHRRLREILGDLDHGIAPPRKNYKLREWLDLWMSEVIIPNRRQKTVDRYEGIIRLHIVPHLGNVEFSKLTPVQVQKLESLLRQEKGMAPQGIQLVHNVLSGAMKHALRMELIQRNPVALVSPPPIPKAEAEAPEIEAVKRLLETGESQQHYLWPCLHLIAYTGMRRGEALGLEWERVEWDKKQLMVSASLVATAHGLSLERPKTSSGRRVVDLDTHTVAVLSGHRQRQQQFARELGVPAPAIVFPRNGLEGWSHPNTLSHALASLSEKAGCGKITFRSLRHFHASVALKTGQNLVVVSKRLGHKKVSTTIDIYAHVLPGWQRETAEAFARAMDSEAKIAGQMLDKIPARGHIGPY